MNSHSSPSVAVPMGPSIYGAQGGMETRVMHAGTVEGIMLFSLLLATMVVSLRVYVRLLLLRHWGLDDWFIIIALLASIGTITTQICYAEWGNVNGILFASSRALKSQFVGSFCYIFANASVKTSILLFCLLAFGTLGRRVRYTLLAVLAWIAFHVLFAVVVALIQCRPISVNWSRDADRSKCIQGNGIAVFNSLTSVLEDIVVFIAPIYLVNQVQSNRKKFLLGILALGAFATGAGIARFISLINFLAHVTSTTSELVLAIVTALEINLAIIAASLPSLSPLLKAAIRNVHTVTTTRARTLPTSSYSTMTGKGSPRDLSRDLQKTSSLKRNSVRSAKSESFPLYGIQIDHTYSVEHTPNPFTENLGIPSKKPRSGGIIGATVVGSTSTSPRRSLLSRRSSLGNALTVRVEPDFIKTESTTSLVEHSANTMMVAPKRSSSVYYEEMSLREFRP